MTAEVVDLFCGIGGLSSGFKNEGFDVRAGIDVDKSCRYAYEENINSSFVSKNVTDMTIGELDALYSPNARRILVGCAPCQPFSMYTGRYRQNESSEDADKRWDLLRSFASLIEGSRPEVVSMENVPRLTVHPAFNSFIQRLNKAGYFVTWQKVRAHDYGVPQRRNRLVLFASVHAPVELVAPTHQKNPITVREAIGSLPAIKAGESDSIDKLHSSRGLSEMNLQRLRSTNEGGSWRDWDSDLQLSCHKKPGGGSFRAVYGRMSWDEPSPVITTQCLGIGNGRFGHPDQDRAISIREAAILQSFPTDFKFVRPGDKVSGVQLARQIGNAVPPRLGSAVARSIKHHLQHHGATGVSVR